MIGCRSCRHRIPDFGVALSSTTITQYPIIPIPPLPILTPLTLTTLIPTIPTIPTILILLIIPRPIIHHPTIIHLLAWFGLRYLLPLFVISQGKYSHLQSPPPSPSPSPSPSLSLSLSPFPSPSPSPFIFL